MQPTQLPNSRGDDLDWAVVGADGVEAKILLVDDDPDFLDQHRLVLQGLGYEVLAATNADEALELADREVPDAFVLDLIMEHTDSGARLSRALRRDPRFKTAPVIMLTSVVDAMGFEFKRNPAEVLNWMKADAWFDKPVPLAEIAKTLQRLLADRGREAGPVPAEPDATGDEATDV